MKKVILSLVLFFSLAINAETNNVELIEVKTEIEVFGECDDVYFAVRDAYFAITGDLIGAIKSAMTAEENCQENEIEIIEGVEEEIPE